MAISNKTRAKVGLPKGTRPEADPLANALGVIGSTMIVEDKFTLSKAEQEVLQSRALSIEDDPWNQLPNERRVNLIKHAYDPVTMINLCLQNNTLGQCVDAMEVNVDGSGYDIERKDNNPVEDKENDETIKPIKEFFDSVFIHESFMSIRRKVRRDAEQTGNGYYEVIRNQAGDITLVNYLDAKLVRMVKLDDPIQVEREITRGGTTQKVQMLVRERRYAQLIGNKVRYFREFGSSREVNSETGEWMGQAKKPVKPQFQATNDGDKVPPADGVQPDAPKGVQPDAPKDAETKGAAPVSDLEQQRKKKKFAFQKAAGDVDRDQSTPKFSTGPRPQDDPTKRPEHEEQAAGTPGTEVIHVRVKPDVSTPYGIPRWINQIPSVLGSRKAEELNLEYFNHGGMPPVMIFLQGGQLSPGAKTELNKYLSGEAKTKMRAVVADVYSTGGDLTSNSQVKVSVERFGGDRMNDSMFEGYDERCAGRVRSAFRLPPLFTGNTEDYNFATAYASYVVAEAQVFKPEREAFDEIVNNTLMAEIAPEFLYRSLPLTVHDVAVQLQAMTLAKDVVDRESFVDEVNEIAGLNLSFQDPMTDPASPLNPDSPLHPSNDPKLAALAGKNPFTGEDFPKEDPKGNPFTKQKQPVKGGSGGKPQKPAGFAKVEHERIAKMGLTGDDVLLDLASDWAAHLAGDRQFETPSINLMSSMIHGLHPQVRKAFNALVGLKLAPGAKYDPDGVSDLMACAGDALHSHD